MNIELRQEVEAELRKTRSPSKVARNLGIDIRLVLPIADEMSGSPRIVRVEINGGEGRPELRPFAVARKKAWEVWDNARPSIAEARANYEAGTHNMFTGRDGDWLIMYSQPNARIIARPDYFKPEL